MMRAVIYCRCSTEEERQVDALKKQVMEARACVKENDWMLVDTYVESKSGTTSKGRREYSRLFSDLQTDRFDIIVIKSQDRLMRNTKDWYLFLDRLQTNGKRLYLYIERKFFTTQDSLITGIKAILAEEFSRELSKKINNAHKYRQDNGTNAIITNNVFGFIKKSDGTVEIDLTRKDAVVRMYQYACTYGCRTIAGLMEEEGVRSKSGKVLNESSIRRIIRSPLNKGIVVMNKTHFDFETKKTIRNPKSEWKYVAGLVPAIVDEDLWQRANDAISSRACERNGAGEYPRGNNPGRYMLSGKLVCGRCGKPYYRTWRCTDGDQKSILNEWKCSGYIQGGRQNQGNIKSVCKTLRSEGHGCDAVHLEEELIFKCLDQVNQEFFQSHETDKANIMDRTMFILEKVLRKEEHEARIDQLLSEQENIRHKKQILLEKLLDEVISDRDYQLQNYKLEEKLDKLESEVRALNQKWSGRNDLNKRLQTIRDNLEQGGFEKAVAGQMLNYIHTIVVHEWQLEIQFDKENYCSIFVDYPFSPNTERGRYLDQLTIMEILKVNPEMTAKKIATIMGRPRNIVWSRMEKLKAEGYIRFDGKGGKGRWEIIKELKDIRKRNSENR